MVVRAGTDQEETGSSNNKKQYVGFKFLVYLENLVTISCLSTVLPDYRGHFFNFLLMLLFSFVGWEP